MVNSETVDYKVRVISPWPKKLQVGATLFDSELASDDADALLCYWAPHEDLFNFRGPKAWYCCEPQCQFELMEGGTWSEIRTRLAAHEFLFHNHRDPRYRVPHITHYQDIDVNKNQDRLKRAVTVVSNFGGGPRSRHPGIAYRNRFATHESVDLFGRTSWKKYRKGLFSFPRTPANYLGEIPGDWPASEKRTLLSKYKVCLCLENMNEPHYFTEKFVEAVAAGCIPVYSAHESLRDSVLKGAKWVDPADYNHDPKMTINAALDMDLNESREINTQWLLREEVQKTSHLMVLTQIGQIFQGDR
ncbi:glycosyltransferase family 10 domain-containing protein [Pseudomonadota bacterium]